MTLDLFFFSVMGVVHPSCCVSRMAWEMGGRGGEPLAEVGVPRGCVPEPPCRSGDLQEEGLPSGSWWTDEAPQDTTAAATYGKRTISRASHPLSKVYIFI